MSSAPVAESLPPRLEEILKALPERAFSGRLRHVYTAAGQAIARLSDMDLVQYETQTVEGSADLSLWEEMAPVIRDTVMDVNALLNAVREQFPQQPRGGIADIVRTATEEAGPLPASSPLARRAQQAVEVLHTAMAQIAQGITQLGEAMRSPHVVSDRWNLLAEIQRFRALFREQMGALVYESVSELAEVSRREVVPGHDAEVKAAIVVRAIVSDLGRIVGARLQKIREAEPEDVQWNAQQLQNELDAFGRTQAYRSLRAQDKRRIIEVRSQVGKLSIQPAPSQQELLAVASELDTFVGDLASVNRRQILIDHDREIWAGCGVRLERAAALLGSDPAGAARALAEAASSAQSLYGRDPALDVFLRRARKAPLGTLKGEELRGTLESLQELLAQLPVG
ncbi:MAG TPA: hypothetical protein VFO83_16730 [Aggregicoccus sp.]|nr:hypothetical protein [Aggregicoccus sp.]